MYVLLLPEDKQHAQQSPFYFKKKKIIVMRWLTFAACLSYLCWRMQRCCQRTGMWLKRGRGSWSASRWWSQ